MGDRYRSPVPIGPVPDDGNPSEAAVGHGGAKRPAVDFFNGGVDRPMRLADRVPAGKCTALRDTSHAGGEKRPDKVVGPSDQGFRVGAIAVGQVVVDVRLGAEGVDDFVGVVGEWCADRGSGQQRSVD